MALTGTTCIWLGEYGLQATCVDALLYCLSLSAIWSTMEWTWSASLVWLARSSAFIWASAVVRASDFRSAMVSALFFFSRSASRVSACFSLALCCASFCFNALSCCSRCAYSNHTK